jgi:hypothetical protein
MVSSIEINYPGEGECRMSLARRLRLEALPKRQQTLTPGGNFEKITYPVYATFGCHFTE